MTGEEVKARMTHVPAFHAEGHDPGCGAHYLEACDCVSGIVRTVSWAFAADLKRLTEAGRAATTPTPKTGG